MGKEKKATKVAPAKQKKAKPQRLASEPQSFSEEQINEFNRNENKNIKSSRPRQEEQQVELQSEHEERAYRSSSEELQDDVQEDESDQESEEEEQESSQEQESAHQQQSELPVMSQRIQQQEKIQGPKQKDTQNVRKKWPKFRQKIHTSLKQFLDDQASQDSEQQSSELSSNQLEEHREQREEYQTRLRSGKNEGQKYYDKLEGLNDDEINNFYKKKQEEEYENYKRLQKVVEPFQKEADDVDLFQVNCNNGMEMDLVGGLLNKARYASEVQDYFCQVVSAMCMPKKLPGLIFLEAQNITVLRQSLQGMKGIKLYTLKKIQLQLFENLMNPKQIKHSDYRLQQYVKIRTGMYRGDLAQITKINKNGVQVQVVPRINFKQIAQRMVNIEKSFGQSGYSEQDILHQKNRRFKQLTDAKTGFHKYRPDQKKIVPSDFEQFTTYTHTKNIKITADGLLLVNYPFQQIEEPTTSFRPLQLLMLNRDDLDKETILKQEAQNVIMALAVRRNDLVQVILGQLKGAYGYIQNTHKRMVTIRCLNKEIKNLVIDQISANVEKKFKQGQAVVVISGDHRGQQGQILKNETRHVTVLTNHHERIRVLKRDVQILAQSTQTFSNDIGIKRDDLIRTRFETGIVCEVKKDYVQFVTTHNVIHKVDNNQITKITDTRNKATTRDGKLVQKDCLVGVYKGYKAKKQLRIKQVYQNFLFLHDPAEEKLNGNWVEQANNCYLFIMVAPRVQARFIEDELKFQRTRNNLPKKLGRKPKFLIDIENDEYAVGRSYRITRGIFKGVKGIIVATFKNHIEVSVFNNKIEKILRSDIQKAKENSIERNALITEEEDMADKGFLSRDRN